MEPKILDVCCGSKMFWFDPNDPRALYLDKRREEHELKDSSKKTGTRALIVDPDIIGDFTKLEFPDNSFPMVVFDPPHMVRVGETGWLARKYGKLPDDWKSLIRDGFSECFRVLKPNGTLIFKWNEIDIPVSQILALTDKKPIVGNRCGKTSKTHWIVFMKEDK